MGSPDRPRAGRREASFQPRSWAPLPARAPGIMNIDVEFHIRHNYPWSKLPANVRQVKPQPGAGAPSPPPAVTRRLRPRGRGRFLSAVSRPSPTWGLGKPDPQLRGEEGTALGPPRQDGVVAKRDGMLSYTGLAWRLCLKPPFNPTRG